MSEPDTKLIKLAWSTHEYIIQAGGEEVFRIRRALLSKIIPHEHAEDILTFIISNAFKAGRRDKAAEFCKVLGIEQGED